MEIVTGDGLGRGVRRATGSPAQESQKRPEAFALDREGSVLFLQAAFDDESAGATRGKEVIDRVKTTVEIPEDVWKAAKFLAVEERTSFQDIVAAALRDYLRRRKKGGKKDEG
jgi:hypothetical protein